MGGERGDGSGDSKGGWVDHGLKRFWVDPLFGIPSFFFNFPFKFIWLAYRADNFRPAKF